MFNIEFKKGQVLKDENREYLVLENNEETLKLFVLNGFYTYEIDKINDKYYMNLDRKDEKLKESDFTLRGYNLGYMKSETSIKIDLTQLKVINDFSIENQKEFFYNLNILHRNKIENSYVKIKYLNQISSVFDKYNEIPNLPKTFSIGDIYKDNLMKTDYFSLEDNDLNLNNNYWTVVEINNSNKTFFAIHLEYLTIAEFNFNGEIQNLLNDVDSRFGKCSNKMPKPPLIYEYQTTKLFVNTLYHLEEVKNNHFFNNIKLIEKVEFNENQKEALWFNYVYSLNYFHLDNPITKNFHFRHVTNELFTKHFDKNKRLRYYDIFDNNNKISEIVYEHNFYDRFVYDDFENKISVLINKVLHLKKPLNTENMLNKNLVENSINSSNKHYNEFFDKLIKEVPVKNTYYFKEEGSVNKYVDFINEERKSSMKTLENCI
jgi:hypothetical protein